MCRLALFNRAALQLLGRQPLEALLLDLETHLGGDGNGIAALWQTTGKIKVRKSVHLSAKAAAGELCWHQKLGADWGLFHTRLATSAPVCQHTCHPFRHGDLVLAHNGHDELYAHIGRQTRKKRSDSEAIAEYWAKRHLPIPALADRPGVFLGFADNQPFVVKGQTSRDLVLAWQQATGALLFVSELPAALTSTFDEVIQVGKLIWQGEPLDLSAVERRPLQVSPTPHTVLEQALAALQDAPNALALPGVSPRL